MELEAYELIETHTKNTYEFDSKGPRGVIRKIVKFQRIENAVNSIFNLYFGDLVELTGKVDDLTRSNNKDRSKILLTVALIVDDFMQSNPPAFILIAGSTEARTRLYQMSICAFWDEIDSNYNVYGNTIEGWVPFEKNINYRGFLVFKKD